MNPSHIVKKPLLTEKSNFASEKFNRHAFVVDRLARKHEIKAAIEEIYGVHVVSVNTINRKDRLRRYKYGYVPGKTTKKAIVRLREGETIELL